MQTVILPETLPVLLRDIDRVHVDPIFEPTLVIGYQDIVTAHLPLTHATVIRKRPIFEAIASLPLHAIICVLVLVPELHCNLVVSKGEQLLSQLIALLFDPLLGQKPNNSLGATEEVLSIPPNAVIRVSFGYGFWVSIVHGIACELDDVAGDGVGVGFGVG